MDDLNNALLKLYAESADHEIDEFIERTLRVIDTFIPFDSAIVAEGQFQLATGYVPRSLYVKNQPIEKFLEYEHVRNLDQTAVRAAATPGVVVTFDTAEIPRDSEHSRIRRYASRYEVRHSLVQMLPRASGAASAESAMGVVAVWRADAKKPFTRQEVARAGALLPHVMHARTINQRCNIASARFGAEAAACICSSSGRIIAADIVVAQLLQLEWPQWSPPVLPADFMATIKSNARMRYEGCRIVATAMVLGGKLWLKIGQREVFPALTLAESSVVRIMVIGCSYKETARQLNLSPATVRNHLHSVYRKLGVRNKVELAARFPNGVAQAQ